MNVRIIQLKRVVKAVLLILLLSVVGIMNAFAQERGLPTVITTVVTKSGNDVVSGGNVVNDGGSPVTARGICYGNNPNPDFGTSFTHTENGTGTGSYTSVISASATGTIYVRAYATNANGTAYGDQVTINRDYSDLPTFEYNGLTYVVAPDPQSNYSSYFSYSAASSYCENLTLYGYSDWRMPSITELEMMYQNRTSIGGFVEGNTYNVVYYHSSTYYNSSYGHYKLSWRTGQRQLNSVLENVGSGYIDLDGSRYYIYCHVRPIRVHIVLPTVTTNNVTSITQTSATCGGNVTDNGGAYVTERGVCWSTTPNPTLSDSHTSDGTNNGSFTSYISNLTPGTQYYVRAYATNSEGTAYGNEVSFTTNTYGVPTVTTNSVFDITTTSAKGGGNVINNGGYTLTEKGICWSTSHNPTTYNSHLSINPGSWNQLGSYTLTMTGLIPGTQYYVRAYAINSEGTAYGDEVSFITNSPPTVTTNSVTNITPNSATCGGNVTAEGSGAVTARGVCWSTSPNPTTINSHTNNGTGTGSFTSTLTGLNQGTLFYVRAYATNSEGTAYGEEVSFSTICTHSVTTNNVSYITQTSATCGGYVTVYYSGTTVTERGVCWSTSNQSPTLSDNHTSSGSGSGNFTSNLTGLTQNTTYYVRAYATSSEGTVYGQTKQFTTTKFEYRISEGGVVATSAGGYFYDSGGPDEEYGNNEQYIMTFKPNMGAGTKIKMTFTEYYTEYWGDYLVIYDGMNTSAPMIGTYGDGNGNSPGSITATNSDGALTFVWISDEWNTDPGWKAAISIVGQSYSYTINTSASPSYGGTVSGGGYYNGGESCTVTAQANDGYVFTNWIENGNVVSTNASYTFTVNSNRSLVANFQAQPQSFTINVSAYPTNGGTAAGGGTYQQGQNCMLTATANTGYTFISWMENGTVISTETTYSFMVTSNRTLVGYFEEQGQTTNHYSPVSQGTSGSMVLTGKIQINGVDQMSDQLELGVFCGNECRGSSIAHLFTFTQPNYYMVDPMVYGDAGDSFTFKLYDHSISQELNYTSPEAITFNENGYGDAFTPYVLNFVSSVSHTQSLASGWNWWSTYIEMDGVDGLEMLKNSLGDACIRIQSRNQYLDNYTTFWYGTLTEITNEQSYRIRTNTDCASTIVGMVTTPENHPITINNGWNWVGFPCSQNVSLGTAIGNFSPEVNDQVKSRHQYATYLGNNYWYGTLNTLEPGQGYMYKSNDSETKTLTYQVGRDENFVANITTERNFFTPVCEYYADNMTLTAVVECENTELRSEDYELAAFVGNECRGSVSLMYVEPIDRYLAFLLAFGDTEEDMRFVLTDGTEAILSDDMIVFAANGTVGTITDPVVLHFGTLGMNDKPQAIVNVFPNPSKDIFNVEGNGIIKVEVIDAWGQIILSKETKDNHMQVALSGTATGIYLLHIITDNGIITHQLIKE